MARTPKAAKKGPDTRCVDCPNPSFGYALCSACWDAGRPFSASSAREADPRPAPGSDRRRRGGGIGEG